MGARILAGRELSGVLAGVVTNVTEAHELAVFFVPKAEGHGFASFPESDGVDAGEDLVRVLTALEVLVGDARAEVVDVVEADVAGEPL